MNELITAIRRYLGDRDPGQTGGDIADVWAAIERAEAELGTHTDGTSTTAFDDQFAPESAVCTEPTDAQIEAIMPQYLRSFFGQDVLDYKAFARAVLALK